MHLRNSSALLSSPSTQLQLEFLGKWLGAKRLHRGNTEECLQEKSKEFKKWGLRINRGEGGPDKFRGACGEAEWIRRQSEGFEGKFVVVSLSFATRVWEEGRFIDESIQGGVSGGTSQCLSLCNPNRETCMHVGVFSVVIKLYDLFVPSGCRVGSSVLNLPKDFWLLLLEASVRVSTLERKFYLVSVFVCLNIFSTVENRIMMCRNCLMTMLTVCRKRKNRNCNILCWQDVYCMCETIYVFPQNTYIKNKEQSFAFCCF